MKGIKWNFTVDALKVCYYIPDDLYNYFVEDTKEQKDFIYKSPNYQDKIVEDFRLVRVKNKLREFEIYVPDNNEGTPMLFGDIKINALNDEDFSNQCYITIDNRRFYEPVSYFMGTQCNSIYYLFEIAERLGLKKIISISNLEIAFDSNINFSKFIKRKIADKTLIPVINKKPYINLGDTLTNVHYMDSSTRIRRKNTSFYLKQCKDDLQVKCYNKSKEIEDNGKRKSYVYKWLGMDKYIHRMEVTAKRLPINNYCKHKNISLHEFLMNLDTCEFLIEPFNYWLFRLIHFKKVEKRKGTFSVFDVYNKYP